MAEKNRTPMMRQYHSIKAKHAGMILFFRMGDFYEMFEQDAVEASSILDLTLTKRQGIPMCGIPYHAAENYLARLIKAGRKVAVCEQVEDPSKAKGIVKREVTRVVTPGTLLDDRLLEGQDNNYLMGIVPAAEATALAVCDISTGELSVTECPVHLPPEQFLADELTRYRPSELLLFEEDPEPQLPDNSITVTRLPAYLRDPVLADEGVREHFKVLSLEGFGLQETGSATAAVWMVVHYLRETQQSALGSITGINRISAERWVNLPSATQANLELVVNLHGGTDHTLFSVLKKTVTPMGLRKLRSAILAPLCSVEAINARLDAVQVMLEDANFLNAVRTELSGIKDLERLITRVVMQRANARDLVSLKCSLQGVYRVKRLLLEKPAFLEAGSQLDDFSKLIGLIDKAILDEPAVQTGDGGMIRAGYNQELDELHQISRNSRDWIASLQARERERTGINSLKIKYNKVMGYFIEVSKANLHLVPEQYERKQTLVGNERYILPELKEYETKILSAGERIAALEERLFKEVRDSAAGCLKEVQRAARVTASVDMYSCFAVLAVERDYVRPTVDQSAVLEIEDGRHPVVEMTAGERFVPNNTSLDLDENRLMIVTGPNMAGKSTFLRQTALITLMAQIGSFVPASAAQIGVVDRISTRVGASDNLARGQSTFLVEMLETAAILNTATERSLIIMDEIGRGTSTYDGLSLAWAVIEFLLEHPDRGGRTLFATHYHELTVLEEKYGCGNLNVMVREWNDEVIFLKKVASGSADKSYGIHVARLAGMPGEVIRRAREILLDLENRSDEVHHQQLQGKGGDGNSGTEQQLPLFRPYEAEVIEQIKGLTLEQLTPLQALNFLANIKEKLG